MKKRSKGKGGGKAVVVIHGPNLDMLGSREPEIYGSATLRDVDDAIRSVCRDLGCKVSFAQRSGEGAIVDEVHAAAAKGRAIVINPGAYAHYSYAIRDALASVSVPKVEVHMTNVHAREPFRRRSVTAQAADGTVVGFGVNSYVLAVRAACALLDAIAR